MESIQKSEGFKKAFFLWAIGLLITLYVVVKLIFVVSAGIKSAGNAAHVSVERDILNHALSFDGTKDYGKSKVICIRNTKDFYVKNHYFYISDYPEYGPSIVVVQTDSYATGASPIYKYGVFPFDVYGSLEGLDVLDKTLDGHGFVQYRNSKNEELRKETKDIEDHLSELRLLNKKSTI